MADQPPKRELVIVAAKIPRGIVCSSRPSGLELVGHSEYRDQPNFGAVFERRIDPRRQHGTGIFRIYRTPLTRP